MAISVDDYNINMPALDANNQQSSNFDYSFDDAYSDNPDQSQFDQYDPQNYDIGNNYEWQGHDPWSTESYENIWASDEEWNGMFDYGPGVDNTQTDEGEFWGTVWDFASSDGMVDFLKGAVGVGLDLWKSNLGSAGSRRYSGGGGGGGGKPTHKADPKKIKGEALTFTRR